MIKLTLKLLRHGCADILKYLTIWPHGVLLMLGSNARKSHAEGCFMKIIVCSLAFPAALTACGGGSDDGSVDGAAWVTQGRIIDANGAGLDGARISVVLDKTYTTTSKSDGSYELKTPRDYIYPAFLAGTVTKLGYLPKPLLFSYSNNQLSSSSSITTRATTDADVLFASGLTVTHLGDSKFGGAANSQFQGSTATGTFWLDSATLTPAQKSKYNELCINFYAKGVESNSSVQDLVSISKNGQAGTYIVQSIPATNSSGAYSVVNKCFPLGSFAAQDVVQVQINSMQTAPNDFDDFEFVVVTGLLQ